MIIATPYYLKQYELYFLPLAFIEAMKRHADRYTQIETLLRLFECYCQITNRSFDFTTLSRKSFEKYLQGFAGSINSGDLADCEESTKSIWIHDWALTLQRLRSEVPEMPDPFEAVSDLETCEMAWHNESGQGHEHLNQEAVKYWRNWPVTDQKGKTAYIAMSALWHSHGPDFVNDIHTGWQKAARKTTSMTLTELNKFVAFLVKNKDTWPA